MQELTLVPQILRRRYELKEKMKKYAENKRRRKESTEERNKPHNLTSSRIIC